MDLPSIIIQDILSRLPIRTLLQCRCVCKTWFNLLSDPYFNNVRLARSAFINVVLSMHDGFYLLELGHDHDCNYTHQPHMPMWLINPLKLGHACNYTHQLTHQPQRPMWIRNALELGHDCNCTHITHRPTWLCFKKKFYLPRRELELVGSCNGLLCFSDYIINPILGEYVALPKPNYHIIHTGYGFGFGCSSATGQYKVLLIVHAKVEVCSLASGAWRKLGDAPFRLFVNQCGVTLNGALHWIVPRSESIYSFDIEDEQFRPIPLPPNFGNGKDFVRLGVLGNCLCVFDNSWHHLDIWSMKDYGLATSWSKDCILKNTIPSGLNSEPLRPITIWNDGEMLMSCRGALVSYNPKRKNFTKVEIDGIGSWFGAITFVSSFHSLKDVPLAACLRILNVNSN